jgi:hypothetical protein
MPFAIVAEYQEQILQGFRKEVALLVVSCFTYSVWSINITDVGETLSHACGLINGLPGVPCPVAVLYIFSQSIGVVVGLNDFGAKIIRAFSNPKAIFVVKVFGAIGWRIVTLPLRRCLATLGWDPTN